MKIRNIIFDFDGTLMDTAPVILATMTATIAELGLPARSEDECRATIGLRLENIPSVLFPGLPDVSAKYADTYRRIFNEKNQPGIARPFPGVVDTLIRLHAAGFRLAIASSRSNRSLLEFIDGLSLSGIFEMLIGGDDVANGKPAPDPVLAICRPLGWNPDETLVVGDACYDIIMGANAGAMTCAVTYGNQNREQLLTAHPDAVIDDFRALIPLAEGVEQEIADSHRLREIFNRIFDEETAGQV